MVQQNANKATNFYRRTFGCIPDDLVTVASEIQILADNANILKYHEGRGSLQGHAVEFPLQFMCKEDLRFKIGQKEYFAPEYSFT